MDQETEKLLKRMEEENGGTIVFKTYCQLYGFSDGTNLHLGGLLYVVNGKLIFEDFEKQPGLLDLFGNKRKSSYEKFKTFRLLSDLDNIRYVKATSVKRVLAGKADASKLPEATGIEKVFSQTLLELSFRNQSNWYIELLQDKDFLQFMEDMKHESI